MGHLSEMAAGSGLSAHIDYKSIPILAGATDYLAQKVVPGATSRNFSSLQNKISFAVGIETAEAKNLLADPQTNGGLLIAVAPAAVAEVQDLLAAKGYEIFAQPIGKMVAASGALIWIQ